MNPPTPTNPQDAATAEAWPKSVPTTSTEAGHAAPQPSPSAEELTEYHAKNLELIACFNPLPQREGAALLKTAAELRRLAAVERGQLENPQPDYADLGAAFVAGAKEARMNPNCDDALFIRAADAYTKLVHSRKAPVMFAAMSSAPAADHVSRKASVPPNSVSGGAPNHIEAHAPAADATAGGGIAALISRCLVTGMNHMTPEGRKALDALVAAHTARAVQTALKTAPLTLSGNYQEGYAAGVKASEAATKLREEERSKLTALVEKLRGKLTALFNEAVPISDPLGIRGGTAKANQDRIENLRSMANEALALTADTQGGEKK